jgi:Ca2+-binding EF-hand superfamily protein
VADAWTVLTSLGEKLTEDEVEELLKGINIGKDGSINYTGIFPHIRNANKQNSCR